MGDGRRAVIGLGYSCIGDGTHHLIKNSILYPYNLFGWHSILYPYNLFGWHSPFDKKLNFVSSELIVPVHSDGKICKQWKILGNVSRFQISVIQGITPLGGIPIFGKITNGEYSHFRKNYQWGIFPFSEKLPMGNIPIFGKSRMSNFVEIFFTKNVKKG